ncbi:hypothetical protein G6F24_018861 [Rhizopus arrhizus]|nr:hypothetical protein G6F24_018861 [Rhizopus arrhizus]
MGFVVHQADHADQAAGGVQRAYGPMPLFAPADGGQRHALDVVTCAVVRVRPGHLLLQEPHDLPLRKDALDGIGVLHA